MEVLRHRLVQSQLVQRALKEVVHLWRLTTVLKYRHYANAPKTGALMEVVQLWKCRKKSPARPAEFRYPLRIPSYMYVRDARIFRDAHPIRTYIHAICEAPKMERLPENQEPNSLE